MDDITQQAEALLAKLKPFSPSAAPGQNFLPPDTRCDVPGASYDTPLWRAGDGPATLFIHGWDDTHRVWRRFAMDFLQAGRPVLLMDLPGHGASKAETCSWPDAGASVLDVCKAEAPIDAVVAHSFGCKAVVRAIETGADIPAIVLIAPPLMSSENSWASRQRKDGVSDTVIEEAQRLHKARFGAGIDGQDFAGTLTGYDGRILLVGSEADESCPLSGIRDLAATLPDADLLEDAELDHRALALDPGILSHIKQFLGL